MIFGSTADASRVVFDASGVAIVGDVALEFDGGVLQAGALDTALGI